MAVALIIDTVYTTIDLLTCASINNYLSLQHHSLQDRL